MASLFAGAGGNPHLDKSDLIGLDTHGTLYYYYVQNNGQLSTRQKMSADGGFAGARLFFASSLDKNDRGDVFQIHQGGLYNHEHRTDSGGPAFLGPGWDSYPTVFGPGDLDDDGRGDLLARDAGGTLYLYPGDGAGYRVGGRIRVGAGWNAYNSLVGAGDLTGDGLTDIVARTPGGTLYLYAGTGTATAPFKPPVNLGSGWNAYQRLAAPGDIDGDGRADLLATDARGDLYRYLSDGTGGFTPRVKIGNGWNTYTGLL
ncbi:FG-GAP repeat domain-containing protein [Streptomyces sp. NPDC059122]|uniref:FG-GAP repeat domain-containing protein n=1 Tax=unclassified Streptomyces TaxID=2593676 RepID=UPI0036768862